MLSPAQLGSAWTRNTFAQFFPAQAAAAAHTTLHIYAEYPDKEEGEVAAVGGWWEEASVFCPWRPFTVRGQPGPAWATPHNCIILFKVLCCGEL